MTADERGAEERRQKLFETRRAAAMLKHAILGRYLVPFAAKAGYSTDHHRVVIIDGYAGAGRYEDGKPRITDAHRGRGQKRCAQRPKAGGPVG